MSSVPWKVRLGLLIAALIACAALAGASKPAYVPVSPQRAAHEPAPRTAPPRPDPSREATHGDEPGPPPLDVVGAVYPTGVTIDGSTKRRIILFSFDDGPSKHTTPALLDMLDRVGVRALFFVKTESFGNANPWEREHSEIVQDIADRGHVIGNHTETHRQLPLLRNAEIESELSLSERKIEHAIGLKPHLIRPPGGALSERVQELLATRGYTSVLWTVYTGDLEVDTADDVVRTFFRVLKRRERETGDRGGIVLLHDTRQHSLEAVPRLVDALKRRNCELLRQDEELYDIVSDVGYFIPGYEPPEPLDARQARLRDRTERDCAALAFR